MYHKNVVRQEKKEGWDKAIQLAEEKIAELKKAIEGFKLAKARGDEWPATQH